MTGGRRSFGPVVLLGLAAAGLTAVAGNKTWFVLEGTASGPGVAAAWTTSGSLPAVGALGLVVLACWGVLLVTRGRVRRAVAVLALAAALGAVAAAVLGWSSAADRLREVVAQAGAEPAVVPTSWAWAGVVGSVLSVLPTALAVRLAPTWPEMGRRYDAPGTGASSAGATAAAAGGPVGLDEADDVGDRSRLDMWRALDEGQDPTA